MVAVTIRMASQDELPGFLALEQRDENMKFVMPYSLAMHQSEMAKPEVTYLAVIENDILVGFIILSMETHTNSVEFRRIVIANKGKGIGQEAIRQMERFCRNKLHGKRIWLDVFAHNHRGQYIYEKLGYRKFRTGTYEGKLLHFYEKYLSNID